MYYDYNTMEVKGVGSYNYMSSAMYSYEMRRMRLKPWRWEVMQVNKWELGGRNYSFLCFNWSSKPIHPTKVYVSNLTKLAATGYVKLLTEK